MRVTKLTKEQVIEILLSPLGCDKLSKVYDVSKTTIEKIKRRHTWKHIDVPNAHPYPNYNKS